MPVSSQLDDPLPGLEGKDEIVMRPFEGFDQRAVTAVAQAYPEQSARVARTRRKIDEIFVFADQDSVVGAAPRPEDQIRGLIETDVNDVCTVVVAPAEVVCQLKGQLIVN